MLLECRARTLYVHASWLSWFDCILIVKIDSPRCQMTIGDPCALHDLHNPLLRHWVGPCRRSITDYSLSRCCCCSARSSPCRWPYNKRATVGIRTALFPRDHVPSLGVWHTSTLWLECLLCVFQSRCVQSWSSPGLSFSGPMEVLILP